MPHRIRDTGVRATRLPRSPRVLLLVDFIAPLDFPGAGQLAARAVAAARATAALKRRLRDEGVACVYANDNYGVWQSDFHSQVSSCLGLDGAPAEIARLLYPQADDITILKPRHSAFYGSPLEILLAEMDTSELVICGMAADMCVQMTAADAFLRQYRTWVPSDCTAAETEEAKAGALAYMASVLKCDVQPADGTAPPRAPRP
ncbi:cysteine hydrolase [Ramlibacter tataouinensis]|uniref:cysteine hydrolase family protein n=1 Tax=Ramlibacter tataouinensis TaxID=94132 RepID=UPI0022F3A3A0|nr:isochorismatase family cysteine hydrolase [Ramlibacter tataouinensis]WBY03898.1 cysteine hydrolase [Ramlibacter tataouinensis]